MDRSVKPQLVVVGNGMAGMRTVEELLALAPGMYDITVFGLEPRVNYNRIMLSPVLAGEKAFDEIVLHTREWYAEHGITLHAGDPVVAIDRRRRTVRAASGREVAYDHDEVREVTSMRGPSHATRDGNDPSYKFLKGAAR